MYVGKYTYIPSESPRLIPARIRAKMESYTVLIAFLILSLASRVFSKSCFTRGALSVSF